MTLSLRAAALQRLKLKKSYRVAGAPLLAPAALYFRASLCAMKPESSGTWIISGIHTFPPFGAIAGGVRV